MNILDWMKQEWPELSQAERYKEMAKILGLKSPTSHIYLAQIFTGWQGRVIPLKHCRRLVQITRGKVSLFDCRPDLRGV